MIESKYGPKDPVRFADMIKAESGLPYVWVYNRPHIEWCTMTGVDVLRAQVVRGGVKYSPCLCPMTVEQLAQYDFVMTNPTLLTRPYVIQLYHTGLEVGNMLSPSPTVWATMVDAKVDYIIGLNTARLVTWL